MAKCSFRGCSHTSVSNSLCWGHYSQQYRGKKLTPLKPVAQPNPVENGTKKCRECKKTKTVSEFYTLNKKGKLSADCKPCYSKKVVERRK